MRELNNEDFMSIIVQRKQSSTSRRFEQNVKNLKKYLGSGTSVIAVVKADGYGHGEVEVAKAVFEAGAEMVSVATPDEAVTAPNGGY